MHSSKCILQVNSQYAKVSHKAKEINIAPMMALQKDERNNFVLSFHSPFFPCQQQNSGLMEEITSSSEKIERVSHYRR